MSLLLAPLREVSIDRDNRAVQALRDGTLTVTLTFKTEAEIRALVKNGDGNHYGVTLTEHGAYCSCPDFLWRGRVCKHIVFVCVTCLQNPHANESAIHLMWDNGRVLCGALQPKRFWQRWTYNALHWPDVCPACVQVWVRPRLPVTKDEHFFSSAADRQAAEE